MENLTKYRQLIKRILERHARPRPSFPKTGVEKLLLMDEERGHYMLFKVGWHEHSRVEWIMIYVRLLDGKVRIESDMTDYGVANELIEAGVPKEDIVLAFQTPEMQPYTELAAA